MEISRPISPIRCEMTIKLADNEVLTPPQLNRTRQTVLSELSTLPTHLQIAIYYFFPS